MKNFKNMNIKCLFGHKWNGCKCSRCGKVRDEQHDWDLCKGKCKRCSKIQQEQHDWNGCKCTRCGKVRDEQHDWDLCKGKCKRCSKTQLEQHVWDGCKCTRCGKVRDEQHDWDGCMCKKCGKTRDEQHDWDGCKCKCCGKIRDEQHDWDECKVKCKRCSKAGDAQQHDWNGCECSRCGEEQHEWDGYECARCGKRKPPAFRFEVSGSREHVNIYGEITHIYASGDVSQGRLARGVFVDVYNESGVLKFSNVEVVHTRGKGMRPDAYSLPDDAYGEPDKYGYVSLETYSSHADIARGDIIVPANFPMEVSKLSK